MKKISSLVLACIVLLQSVDAFAAAAAVARRKQMMQRQQQEVEQQMIQQQMVQQQQAAMQQQMVMQQQAQQRAQQQAIVQYQQQQMQVQAQQMLMRVMQEKAAYAAQVQAQAQANQIVNAQQMAMVSGLAAQYQKAVMDEAIKQKVTLDAAKMAQIQQMAQAQAEVAAMQQMQAKTQAQTFVAGQEAMQKRPFVPSLSDEVEDTVDITDVWRKLDVDSRAWTLLIDPQAKVSTVSEYMDRFRKQGVRIQGSPSSYAEMIDQLAIENPSLLTNPFKNLVQLVAIMEYDFDSGMDKDLLAKKFLGQSLYESNRKRLGR